MPSAGPGSVLPSPGDQPRSDPTDLEAELAHVSALLARFYARTEGAAEEPTSPEPGGHQEFEVLVGRALLQSQLFAETALADAERRSVELLAEANRRAAEVLSQAEQRAAQVVEDVRQAAVDAFHIEAREPSRPSEAPPAADAELRNQIDAVTQRLEESRRRTIERLDAELARLGSPESESAHPDFAVSRPGVEVHRPASKGQPEIGDGELGAPIPPVSTPIPPVEVRPAAVEVPNVEAPRPAPPRARLVPPPLALPVGAPPAFGLVPPLAPAPAYEPSLRPAWSPRPDRPAAAPAPRSEWLATGFGWVRNTGILILLFVAFQLWGTGIGQGQAQSQLKSDLRKVLPAAAASVNVHQAKPASGSTATAIPALVREGAAVALLEIPKLSLSQAVVEGTNVDDLKKAPGHYRGSALPGQIGNVAIAGHRTTYGAPFSRINELKAGDEIFLTSQAGRYRYVVSKDPFVVQPWQREAVAPTPDAELTLTTCHPRYEASKRLIVDAKLQPDASHPAAATAAPASQAVSSAAAVASVAAADARLSSFDFWVFPQSLMWVLLLLYAWIGTKKLSQVWSPRISWAIAIPVMLILLFEFFVSVNSFLPAYL